MSGAVAFGIVIHPVVDNLIFAVWGGESLSGVIYPCGSHLPSLACLVHADDVNVVAAVVVGIVPSATVDAVDPRLRPREGVREPSREATVCPSSMSLLKTTPSIGEVMVA